MGPLREALCGSSSDSVRPDGVKMHPIESASYLSFLFLHWLQPIISLGARRPLELSDLPDVPLNVKAAQAGTRLEAAYNSRLARARAAAAAKGLDTNEVRVNFLLVLGRCFLFEWLWGGFFLILYVAASVVSPLVLQALLSALNEPEDYAANPFMGIQTKGGIVGALVCCLLVSAFSANTGFMLLSYLGVQMRAAIMFNVFRKSLRLSPTVTQGSSNGEIVNLMSNDSERIFFALLTSHMIWISPVLIVVVIGLLFDLVGFAGLAALVLVVLIFPVQIRLGQEIGRKKRRMLAITDLRVGVTAEALSGINVIKMNAWEPQMSARVQAERRMEMRLGRNVLFLFTINNWLLFIAPTLIALAIFTVVALSGEQELTLVRVFTVLAFVNVLRFPFMILPRAIAALAQAMVSGERIERFLRLAEISRLQPPPPNAALCKAQPSALIEPLDKVDQAPREPPVVVDIRNGNFTWEDPNHLAGDSPKPVLRNINLQVRQGELVAIVGRVGGGKSSLLSAILGEIGTLSGSVSVCPAEGRHAKATHVADDTDAKPRGGNMSSKAEALLADTPSFNFAGGQSVLNASANANNVARKGIAYVSQEAWIQNATLRENILFQSAETVSALKVAEGAHDGLAASVAPVDEALFRTCVRATELKPDIRILPHGLATEIGDRGVNLSGGQKARVAIARALYRTLRHDLDLVLVDDAFSALDPGVGLKVFKHLLLDLLDGRTRIVVLNSQMHLLERFDRIVAVQDGEIVLNAPANQALNDPLLHEIILLGKVRDEDEASECPALQVSDDDAAKTAACGPASGAPSRDSGGEDEGDEGDDGNLDAIATEGDEHAPVESAAHEERLASALSAERDSTLLGMTAAQASAKEVEGRLYGDENRKRGKLNFSNYAIWLKAAGCNSSLLVFVLVVLFAGGQSLKVASEYWLGVWSDEQLDIKYGLGVFGGLVASMAVFVLARGLLFMSVAARSAVSLHNGLIINLLRAPVNLFFDVTPAGRILNRISNDLDKVDQFLPETFYNFLSNLLQVISTVILCAVASPYFLLFLAPVVVLFWYFGAYFSRTSRELKRIESVSRSPLYSNFAEVLAGISTVRAFVLESALNRKNEYLIDNNARAFLLFWMAARWLALRLDLLITLLQSSVALLAVLLGDQLDANVTALALIYAMQLTGLLQFTIRLSVETENAFTSVERLWHYTTSIPQERPARVAGVDPAAAEWPTRGSIEFQDVSLRYRPNLDLVLHRVSFRIEGGEKVGICGRSGAGKSTISAALFRLVDPLETGRVLIDDVDVSTIGLAALREQVGIIPQQPVIFSGSLRFNLDPWGRHSDRAIKDALDRVQLSRLGTENMGLDLVLHDKGQNLSIGERQLISIARAILQGARLVMSDEATANIDSATDALIQQTIRHEFRDQTLLVIAHRMQTIVDSDKILVLSFGAVAEFDAPANLIARPDSLFASMLRESQMT